MSITNINHVTSNSNNVALGNGLITAQDSAMRQDNTLKAAHIDLVVQKRDVISDKALEDAVKKINDFIAPTLQTIQFSIDQESGRLVVKVIDTATQKILRQMPNEVALNVAKTLDGLKGLIVSLKV